MKKQQKKLRLKEVEKILSKERKRLDKYYNEKNKLQEEITKERMLKSIGKCFVYSYEDTDYDDDKKRTIYSYSKIIGIKYGMFDVIDISEDIHGQIKIRGDSFSESFMTYPDFKEVDPKVFQTNYNILISKLNRMLE